MPQTVVLTGASGFIAKHVLLRLLAAGHSVRATLRTPARADEVRAAVLPHLPAEAAARLDFVALDLTRDAGWAEALAGADALIHTASPFPMVQPKDEAEVIRPAVDGALRALRAARDAHLSRVVLTSSSVAVVGTDLPPGKAAYDESVWSRPDYPTMTAYGRSKLAAERAAWAFARETPEMALTAINPGFVLGAPLDRAYGTSLKVIERLMRARDPMLPRFAFPCVDVRDVAEAHLRALEVPGAAGERFVVADETLWFSDMAREVRAALPGRRIVTRDAPNAVVRMLALFDPAVRTIVPALGRFEPMSAAKAGRVLGLTLAPARQAVRTAARWLAEEGGV
jgi:dihydroflavonol-4-reductase